MTITILAILSVALAAAVVYLAAGGSFSGKALAPQKAADLALEYINKDLLKGRATATLSGEVKEEEGLYKIQVQLGQNKFFSYVTKDGKLLFPEAFALGKKSGSKKSASASVAEKCKALPKTEKPLLKAFVVSYCPFGLQMQRILGEIEKNIPSLKDNIRIEYIGSISKGKITSMHGDKEARENLRQICLREEQPTTFYPYLACHIKKGDVQPCLKEARVDEKKLKSCESDKSRGLAYAAKDFADAGKYKVNGSPTLILSNKKASEFDFGGRTAEAVKKMICCSFSKEPSFCAQKLTSQEAATGFSPDYGSGKANSGSCN